MLAVVDDFSRARKFVRRCASAYKRTALEEFDKVAGVGECATCGEACQAATYDRDAASSPVSRTERRTLRQAQGRLWGTVRIFNGAAHR